MYSLGSSGNCHDAEFVYAVCYSGSVVLTASEDNSVKVWESESLECIQTLHHPSTCWSVCTFPGSGDIAVGCADHHAYVWSADPTRALQDSEALDDFNERAQVASGLMVQGDMYPMTLTPSSLAVFKVRLPRDYKRSEHKRLKVQLQSNRSSPQRKS